MDPGISQTWASTLSLTSLLPAPSSARQTPRLPPCGARFGLALASATLHDLPPRGTPFLLLQVAPGLDSGVPPPGGRLVSLTPTEGPCWCCLWLWNWHSPAGRSPVETALLGRRCRGSGVTRRCGGRVQLPTRASYPILCPVASQGSPLASPPAAINGSGSWPPVVSRTCTSPGVPSRPMHHVTGNWSSDWGRSRSPSQDCSHGGSEVAQGLRVQALELDAWFKLVSVGTLAEGPTLLSHRVEAGTAPPTSGPRGRVGGTRRTGPEGWEVLREHSLSFFILPALTMVFFLHHVCSQHIPSHWALGECWVNKQRHPGLRGDPCPAWMHLPISCLVSTHPIVALGHVRQGV